MVPPLWTESSLRDSDSGELGWVWSGGVGFVLMEGRAEKEHGANWVGDFLWQGHELLIFMFLNLCRAWHFVDTLQMFLELNDIFVSLYLGLLC